MTSARVVGQAVERAARAGLSGADSIGLRPLRVRAQKSTVRAARRLPPAQVCASAARGRG